MGSFPTCPSMELQGRGPDGNASLGPFHPSELALPRVRPRDLNLAWSSTAADVSTVHSEMGRRQVRGLRA